MLSRSLRKRLQLSDNLRRLQFFGKFLRIVCQKTERIRNYLSENLRAFDIFSGTFWEFFVRRRILGQLTTCLTPFGPFLVLSDFFLAFLVHLCSPLRKKNSGVIITDGPQKGGWGGSAPQSASLSRRKFCRWRWGAGGVVPPTVVFDTLILIWVVLDVYVQNTFCSKHQYW